MQTGTFNPFINIRENIFHLLIKVIFHDKKKSVYQPSGSSGWSLSKFQ